MKSRKVLFAALLLAGGFSSKAVQASWPGAAVPSGDAGAGAREEVSDGGDDFLLFEEEARAMTDSRLAPRNESHVSADIVTGEEIRVSGAQNLWDVLRFRTGMDVIDARVRGGNRAVISVRGFPQSFVSNLQVLVDGRSVYSSLAGGVFWEQIPVQLQDIDRIEIVHGPNSALYGFNAGLGVINIITKKPEAKTSVAAKETVGSRGTFESAVSVQSGAGVLGYRLSHTYLTTRGGEAPPGGRDFLRSNKGNFRGSWKTGAGSELELYAGGSADNAGGGSSEGVDAKQNFQTLKFTAKLGPGSYLETTASRSEMTALDAYSGGNPGSVREQQYDAEILHRFEWGGGRLKTSWGAGSRSAAVSGFMFQGNPSNNAGRIFAQQLVKVSGTLNLVGAASLEHSGTGGRQENYQGAMLLNPEPEHTFRLSYSKSATVPNLFSSVAEDVRGAVVIQGNSDIKPEQLRSTELGYGGSYLDNTVNVEAAVFYMTVKDLTFSGEMGNGSPGGPGAPGGPPAPPVSFNNSNGAIARGGEFSLQRKLAAGRSVYVNYTCEYISDNKSDVNVRSGTPRNKVNLGFIAAVGSGFTLSSNAGYKDVYVVKDMVGAPQRIPAFWRLDVRLAYGLGSRSEVFLSARNLLRAVHREYADGYEIPRVFYSGISIVF